MSLFLLVILLLLTKISHTTSGNAGSVLFKSQRAISQCWSGDDIVRLQARKSFEDLLPVQVHPDKVNGRYTSNMLRYLRKTLHSVEKQNDPHISKLLQEAIADTIGAHLRYEILPTTRFAFYAGYAPYRNVRQIHDFYEEVKRLLNTQGLGWKRPERTPPWSNMTVAKILIGAGTFFDPCSSLVIKRDANLCIHMPMPRLDDEEDPSALALPFRTDGLVSLSSPNSNKILLKYYTIASRCILSSSPEKCRHADFLSFNNDLWNWMKRDVAPHLLDEKVYPAYGGILRIAAAVQTYGKGLSRRNLFEYEGAQLAKWHPWKSLAQSYVYIYADWSPKLYVGVVVAVALAIYLIQISYNYLCGANCQCNGGSKVSLFSKNVAYYADVESNIPAMLPNQKQHSACNNESRSKLTLSKTKSASLGSIRTQKVFDLNDNTEKLMPIMSGNEYSESSSSETDECENKKDLDNKSPPKIDIAISQVKIRQVNKKPRSSLYSISTATHDTYGVETHTNASYTSSTASYSSDSGSSTTSKSCISRHSHDLAWAKRVMSKHSIRSTQSTSRTDIDQQTAVRTSTKSITSRTELDLTSFTTPPSHH